jgi:hypothetical protein
MDRINRINRIKGRQAPPYPHVGVGYATPRPELSQVMQKWSVAKARRVAQGVAHVGKCPSTYLFFGNR